jgi:hypothetical protein
MNLSEQLTKCEQMAEALDKELEQTRLGMGMHQRHPHLAESVLIGDRATATVLWDATRHVRDAVGILSSLIREPIFTSGNLTATVFADGNVGVENVNVEGGDSEVKTP